MRATWIEHDRARIALRDGRVRQNNFHDYIVTRMSGMLPINVHIVPSGDPPTGVGEPGLPPMTPAIANAIHALIGNPAQSFRPGSGEHTGGGPVGGG